MHLDLAESNRIAERHGVAIVLLDMVVMFGGISLWQFDLMHDGIHPRQATPRAPPFNFPSTEDMSTSTNLAQRQLCTVASEYHMR